MVRQSCQRGTATGDVNVQIVWLKVYPVEAMQGL